MVLQSLLRFECCFCDKPLDASDRVEIVLIPPGNDPGTQQLWAHKKCLARIEFKSGIVLHPALEDDASVDGQP